MSDKSFTRSGMGTGRNSDVTSEKLPNGDTLKSAFGLDNTHGLTLPDTKGDKFGGSTTNLSHSLTGSSAVQK